MLLLLGIGRIAGHRMGESDNPECWIVGCIDHVPGCAKALPPTPHRQGLPRSRGASAFPSPGSGKSKIGADSTFCWVPVILAEPMTLRRPLGEGNDRWHGV
jgi:hypothetical protein